jgi:succinate dehydrogenase / fumarate reductase cytochrome b subunit
VVPVGAFLISHLVVNATAIQGEASFHRAAAAIGRLPLLLVWEWVGIALPMFAHVAIGIVLGTTSQAAEDRRGFGSRAALLAQRISGFVLLVYVVFHVWGIRLSPARAADGADLFALTRDTLAHPGVLAYHAAGVLAAAWHFGNGVAPLFGPWGWDRGPGARRRASRVGMAAFVVLALLGFNALLAFVNPSFRWLEGAAR